MYVVPFKSIEVPSQISISLVVVCGGEKNIARVTVESAVQY